MRARSDGPYAPSFRFYRIGLSDGLLADTSASHGIVTLAAAPALRRCRSVLREIGIDYDTFTKLATDGTPAKFMMKSM